MANQSKTSSWVSHPSYAILSLTFTDDHSFLREQLGPNFHPASVARMIKGFCLDDKIDA